MKLILIQSDYKAASDKVWAREAATMLSATGKTWQLWKSCRTGVQSESTGNSRPPEVFHHHLLTSRYVNIRDIGFYLQMHICFNWARWKGLPQNFVWQYLELLHCLISVPILHFPVTSVAPTHTPSLAPRDDQILPPSNESTTSSNQGIYVRSMLILHSCMGIDAML